MTGFEYNFSAIEDAQEAAAGIGGFERLACLGNGVIGQTTTLATAPAGPSLSGLNM